MVTLSFTIFSGQKNYNRAHMLFQVLCGFEPIFYTTHPNEESNKTAFSPYFIQLIKYQSMHPALPPQISSYKVLQDHLHFHIYCKDFQIGRAHV